jgi:predicted RNase H-like HicB family nuclease
MRKYPFVTHQEGKIWSVTSPSIPGVFGTGKTAAAAEKDFAQALGTLCEYLDEIGEKLPPPKPVRLGSIRV